MYSNDLNFDFDAIRDRIDQEKKGYRPTEWAKKVGVKKNVISNIHGKSKKQNPSWKYIFAVSIATGKSIEYYLWGTKKVGDSSDDLLSSFKDRERAKNYIALLVKLEKIGKLEPAYNILSTCLDNFELTDKEIKKNGEIT